jgi:hypothetical protein
MRSFHMRPKEMLGRVGWPAELMEKRDSAVGRVTEKGEDCEPVSARSTVSAPPIMFSALKVKSPNGD